jgi:hypothetical protein
MESKLSCCMCGESTVATGRWKGRPDKPIPLCLRCGWCERCGEAASHIEPIWIGPERTDDVRVVCERHRGEGIE